MAGPTVVVSVLADSAKFKRDIADIGGHTSKLGGFFKTAARVGAAALAALTIAAVGFLGTSIKAAAEAQRIGAQTAAVLESTAGAAGKTAEQISGLSLQLSRLSGIDDEVIQKGQNVLLTFTNIKGVNFDAATKSALNMSVAMGTDLAGASKIVGRALNDPIAGMAALTRVGVQLSASQKEAIKALVETGDVAGAQAIILEALNVKFGGSAEALGATFDGVKNRVKNAFGNIQETVGSAFLPAFTTVLGKVATVLERFGDSPAFQAVTKGVQTFLDGLVAGGAVTSAFGDAFRVLSAILNPFGIVLQALVPILPTLAASFTQLGSALGGALLSVLPTLATLLDAVVGALSGVLAAVLPVVIGLVTQLAQIFADLAPVLVPIITLLADILAKALVQLAPVIALVAEALGGILSAALTALAPLLQLAAEFLMTVLEAIAPLIPVVLDLLGAFAPLLPVIAKLIGAILPPLVELLSALLGPILKLVSPLLELLVPALIFLTDVLAGVIGFVVEVIGAFVALITGSKDADQKVRSVWQGVLNFFSSIPKKIAGFFSGAVNWLRSAGINIVNGLLNGIRSMAGKIGSFFLNLLPGWIVGPFKLALGIASDSKLFKALGLNIGGGLITGVRSTLSAVSAISSQLAGATVAGFGTPSASFAGAIGGSRGGNTYEIHLPVGMPSAEAGRAIVRAIDEYERIAGPR